MPTLYGIIDAAQDERLYGLIAGTPHHDCLFAGKLDDETRRASPYLVKLDTAPKLLSMWQTEGRGRNWGIQCFSEFILDDVRRHFRHFLQARLPDGSIALFRFYDPRIFSAYLPTCDGADLRRWFDAVDEYVTETHEGDELVFFVISGRLESRRRASVSGSGLDDPKGHCHSKAGVS